MSQENVDFMRDAFEAFAGDDPLRLAGLLSPNVEWQAVEDPAPKRGLEGVLESLGAWYEVWQDTHIELEELIDQGTNVVAAVKFRGRHVGSRSVVTQRFFQVWTISGGEITAFREYRARDEALEAARMSEQDAHADS